MQGRSDPTYAHGRPRGAKRSAASDSTAVCVIDRIASTPGLLEALAEGRPPHRGRGDDFLVAAERRALGQVYQSSPIALRFVKASPAYLSMMHGRDTMMIELIGLNGNDGGIELLKAYEEALYALGGRPHWGHINTLTGSHGFVESMYPRLGDWRDVRARLDPGGVFDSPFTKRVGLSSDRFAA